MPSVLPFLLRASAAITAALALASCGGGSSTSAPSRTSGGNIAVGEPAPGAPDRAAFIAMARDADCVETHNRLYVVDNELVVWDRAGSCADSRWNVALFRSRLDNMLCTAGDSSSGPGMRCRDEQYRGMLTTIVASLGKPDLGLGSAHKVEAIPFAERDMPLEVTPLLQEDYSSITQPQQLAIRDAATLQQVWNAHFAGRNPRRDPPFLDFSRSMVVAVFMGTQATGCRSVSIPSARLESGRIVVEYQVDVLQTYAPCTQANTAPAAFAVVDRTEGEVRFVDQTPQPVPFTSVDLDPVSGIATAGVEAVRDADAWAALWRRHKANILPPLPVPAVDFQRYMVIGVFAGSKPNGCYGMTVANVVQAGGKLQVTRIDHEPAPERMCPQVIVAPAQLILVPRSELPVVVAARTAS